MTGYITPEKLAEIRREGRGGVVLSAAWMALAANDCAMMHRPLFAGQKWWRAKTEHRRKLEEDIAVLSTPPPVPTMLPEWLSPYLPSPSSQPME